MGAAAVPFDCNEVAKDWEIPRAFSSAIFSLTCFTKAELGILNVLQREYMHCRILCDIDIVT